MDNERKTLIIRVALLYLGANLDDAIRIFGTGPQFHNRAMRCKLDYEVFDSPDEGEIADLLEGEEISSCLKASN